MDQVTKAVAVSTLSQEARRPLLGDLLGLQLAYNPGAILSFGAGSTWLLTLIGVVAVIGLAVAAVRVRSGWAAAALGLILGGAIGNLIDRLFSPPSFGIGRVTDFLAYSDWFIGNFADIALGAGVILAVIVSARQQPIASRDEESSASAPAPAGGGAR
ncbi:signal peptidase II [Microbacterium trichothecenolyticum]